MVFIPQGGTIRNSIQWESFYSEGGSWYLHTCYGEHNGGTFNIYFNKYTILLNHPEGVHDNVIDITIPADTTPGIYDAWTVLLDGPDLESNNILAEKFDDGVLEIVPFIQANIISTTFTKI